MTATIYTPTTQSHDLQWIRGALQTAIAIEHATMPVYSAAMYSLEVQNYPAYNTIRSVLMEEMLHMAAASNMVAALGGRPRIKSLDPTALSRGMPGNVAPGLRARCAKLSRRQLDTFMRIEAPELLAGKPTDEDPASGHQTIGSFYEAIKEAIVRNADAVIRAARGRMRSNQVGGNLGYSCIDSHSGVDIIDQFIASIDLIQQQGEGSTTTLNSGPTSDNELSHYARFAELRFGHRYNGPAGSAGATATAEGQRRYFRGDSVTWPTVINMLAVPADGYEALLGTDPNGADARKDLEAFDAGYTRMLAALDDCWNGPVDTAWPSLGRAVYEMNELRVTSCFRILRREIPSDALERLSALYPAESNELAALTDLSQPAFYGPRFRNTMTPAGGAA